jgi:hypothetical protein
VALVALLCCTGGVVLSPPLSGTGLAGVPGCCDLVGLVRCTGVVRGVVSAGVESPGCVEGCAADFLAVVVALLARVRGAAVSDGATGVTTGAAAEEVLAVPVTFCAGVAVVPLAKAAVEDADVVRCLVAGLTSCSELSGMALSVLERVLARLLVVAGFTCSLVLASGDSDVFLMKKTPFYWMVRLKRRRKSLFTATKKYCRLLR